MYKLRKISSSKPIILRASALAMALMLSLTACGGDMEESESTVDIATETASVTSTPSDSATPTPSESATPTPAATEVAVKEVTPQSGGTLTLAMRTPSTLNPLLNDDASVDSILKLIFEPLAVLDENQRPVPNSDYVESFELEAGGMSILVTLKSGAKWSDGTAITANDISFTISLLKQVPETSLYKTNADAISSAVFLTERTVRINFSEPTGSAYALCIPILPSHYYSGISMDKPNEGKNMQPLGNGLFAFTSYTIASKMELVASENAASGKPYINNVTVLITSSQESDLQSFDAGVLDAVYAGFSDWGKRSGDNVQSTAYMDSYFDFIGFNHNRALFQDESIRKLIAQSLDVDALIETIYINHAISSITPINPSSWLAQEVSGYQFDIEQVKSKANDYKAAGRALNFTILVNEENSLRVKIANLLAENLNEAGFTVTVESVDFSTYSTRVTDGDYDIFVGGYGLAFDGDLSFMLHSSNIGGTNVLNYNDEQMDLLLEAVNAASTESGYLEAVGKVQQYIAEHLPLVGIAFRESAVISGSKVYGEFSPRADNIYNNIEEWFIYE